MKTITLKNLHKASKQAVFDQVATHLLKQNKQSLGSIHIESPKEQGCAYRGENGLKCAAGCLMADDEYRWGWENWGWGQLVSAKEVPRNHRLLILALQGVHDKYFPNLWRGNLELVAKKFKLNTDAIN